MDIGDVVCGVRDKTLRAGRQLLWWQEELWLLDKQVKGHLMS